MYQKDGESSTKNNTYARTKYSLAKEKEALNLWYKGTQKPVDINIKKHIQQVARKTVRIARKVK